MLEQGTQRHLQVEAAAYPGNHLGHQQRVAAQLEEVVVPTNVAELQDLAPDRRHGPFQLALGRDMGVPDRARVRQRQRLAVDLAVRRQRQVLQQQHVRRHHVVRENRQQAVLQCAAQFLLARRLGADQRGLGGHQVGHQGRPGHPRLGDDHRLAHAVLLQQARLDFAEFDAESPDLHLMVDPSKVFDDPIGAVASQVAGAVQARTVGGERVGQEAFGGQAGAAMVATRQAIAADQQFAGDAGRTWVHFAVEDVQSGVFQRPAEERPGLFAEAEPCRPDRRLGRPVEIPGRCRQSAHTRRQVLRQRLATAQQGAATQQVDTLAVAQHPPGRRGRLQYRDALPLDQIEQGLGILGLLAAGEQHAGATRQRYV
ncbi:hypothetical protein CRPA7_34710 [Pseudomonas aeruginosa]